MKAKQDVISEKKIRENKDGEIFFSISVHLRLNISIAKFLDKKEFLYLTIFCIFLIY